MRKFILYYALVYILFGCKSTTTPIAQRPLESDFTVAFGSCNKHDLPNLLWDDILAANPDLWIWGGDNVYADTDDMKQLQAVYAAQDAIEGYASLKSNIPFIGTWDDHDYGLNDGGIEFQAKQGSQNEFLNFMNVPPDSPRRQLKGIYSEHDYALNNGSVKVIVLDTRYFRTAITPDTLTSKRLKPNDYGVGTILGEAQWEWLDQVLSKSKANFNIIVSSIQFLSNEHGFECWGNFPHEVDKMKQILNRSMAKGVIFLSGDRHISEFSKLKLDGMTYPLVDFTSSGLTHAYSNFKGEANPYRIGEVIKTESFGLLRISLKTNTVEFEMVGDNLVSQARLRQSY